MIRLRPASAIVALSLLTSVSTVSADCAWVVWNQVMSNNPSSPPGGVWQPVESFKGPDQCKPYATNMDTKMKGVTLDAGGYKYLSSFVCLPDTVDPRGPKGK